MSGQDKLIDAAEAYAVLYDDDDRDCIKTDVMNAFFAGHAYRVNIKHVGECAADPIAEQVCDAIYQERTDDNLALCEALRAIYALCGEDEQIVKIINDALQDYGVGEA